MRKILLIVSAVAMLGAVSCKKDYDCKCQVFFFSETTVIEKSTKKDAEDKCKQIEEEMNAAGEEDDIDIDIDLVSCSIE